MPGVESTPDNQLAEVLAKLNNTISAKFAAPPAPPAPPEKTWTRSELNDQVLTGALTQDTADAILDRQVERRIVSIAQNTVQTQTMTQTAQREIDRYKALIPNAAEEGTTERDLLVAEYRELVSLGQPETIATELAALKIAFGKLSAIEAARASRQTAEFHQDTGGGDSSPGKAKGPLAKIPARFREHYQDMIKKGQYSGEDDPDLLAELKYVNAA